MNAYHFKRLTKCLKNKKLSLDDKIYLETLPSSEVLKWAYLIKAIIKDKNTLLPKLTQALNTAEKNHKPKGWILKIIWPYLQKPNKFIYTLTCIYLNLFLSKSDPYRVLNQNKAWKSFNAEITYWIYLFWSWHEKGYNFINYWKQVLPYISYTITSKSDIVVPINLTCFLAFGYKIEGYGNLLHLYEMPSIIEYFSDIWGPPINIQPKQLFKGKSFKYLKLKDGYIFKWGGKIHSQAGLLYFRPRKLKLLIKEWQVFTVNGPFFFIKLKTRSNHLQLTGYRWGIFKISIDIHINKYIKLYYNKALTVVNHG